ncbi:MAG: insulinase family protein [Spirochaetaceae bacterium]|nr:insulinase family protein [Spirochaetaceae bacterium]
MKKILYFLFVFFLFSCNNNDTNKGFSKEVLKNGIPIIFKKDEHSSTLTIKILVKGFRKSFESGDYLSLLFKTLTSGSGEFSYDEIQALLYENQAAFSGSVNQNGGVLTLSCLSHQADILVPMLLDGFLNPSFNDEQLERCLLETEHGIHSTLNTPFSLLLSDVKNHAYQDHPFYEGDYTHPDFVSTLREGGIVYLRKIHDEILNAKRISVIVTGNFNKEMILTSMDYSLSSLPAIDVPEMTIPQATVDGNFFINSCDASANTAFLTKMISAPDLNSPEKIPADITADIFSEILFNVVREKYGACYSVYSSFILSRAPYGLIYSYMASSPNEIPQYYKEAQQILQSGNVIADKDQENSSFKLMPLQEALNGYKNSRINSVFSDLETSAGQANAIATGILLYDNEMHYFSDLQNKIRQVTDTNVLDVFNKYWISGDSSWFVVTGTNENERINIQSFMEE